MGGVSRSETVREQNPEHPAGRRWCMKFLEAVADRYARRTSLERTCFVFPNRRSAVFFRKDLGERAGRPLFVPALRTIDELFQDISGLQQEGTDPVPAGSFRAFDQSDGVFFPSILGPMPETWVFLDPSGRKIEINGPMEVIVRSETKVTIKSDTQIDMQAPKINLRGSVTMGNTAGDAGSDTMTFIGNLNMDGALTTSGNIRSEGSITAPHIHED